jgi:hypothetical protein
MKEIKYTNFYCVRENFCDFIYYGFGIVINYSSGSAKVRY